MLVGFTDVSLTELAEKVPNPAEPKENTALVGAVPVVMFGRAKAGTPDQPPMPVVAVTLLKV